MFTRLSCPSIFLCVDFSFCCFLKYTSSFSLEQNSGCSCRQAFIHYCGPHQVWGRTEELHLILEQHGREVLQLFKGWERFQLRDCNYRNHRIFTLKCISNELVPVSLRWKTTIKTERASKIIRKAEKDLQARVKSINSILGDNATSKGSSVGQSSIFSINLNNGEMPAIHR